MVRAFLLAAGLSLIAAGGIAQQTAGDPRRGELPGRDAAFEAWLADFEAKALAAGISQATLERELAELSFDPRVIELDRAQPGDASSAPPLFSAYLERRLTPARIEPGRRLHDDLSATLSAIEAQSGVPGEVLLGVFGMETSYGAITGGFDVLRSLASLAFDGRREKLFTRELIAALKMIDQGLATREMMQGSWAGAMGNVQFLPSSYLKHAVDQDGDGRPDIWTSRADSLASIGNYLKDYGWRPGGDWAIRVAVPPGLERWRVRDLVRPPDCERVLEKHSRWLPVAEWRELGLTPLDGRAFPRDDVLATLVEVDGPGTGGYLTFGNYRALLGYNCSNFYALSVSLLADRIEPPEARMGADAAADGGGLR